MSEREEGREGERERGREGEEEKNAGMERRCSAVQLYDYCALMNSIPSHEKPLKTAIRVLQSQMDPSW